LGDQETRANEKGILLAQMQGKYAVRKSWPVYRYTKF
jgi:hypothetical protein